MAKFDTAGKRVWIAPMGGSEDDAAGSIALDIAGNCYVAGTFAGTAAFGAGNLTNTAGVGVFLAKYTADGDLLWVKQASSAPSISNAGLAVDAAGNLSLAGSFESTASFGDIRLTSQGGSDSFVAHYDSAGNLLWVRQAGGDGDDYGNSVSVDAAGNSMVTGAFSRTAAFGQVNLTSAGADDLFLAKYDRAGQLLWVKQAGGSGDDVGFSVAAEPAGGVYVTGNFTGAANFAGVTLTSQGSNDVFVAKFDGAGNLDWVKSAGGLGDDNGYGVALDSMGHAYVTGWFQNEAQFGGTKLRVPPREASAASNRDIFVAAYSAAGDVIWAGSAGGAGDDYANAIAVDGAGDLHVVGEFRSSKALFGNVELPGSGDGNAFITELAGYVLRFVKPTIVSQPESQSVTAGGDITFGVRTEGSVPLAYQWRRNDAVVAGATNATLAIRNALSVDAGFYSVVVSNAGGSAASSNAVLTLALPARAPSLTGFSPAAGIPGTLINLAGANFTEVIDLRFDGTSSGFVILSSTQIITAVPDGATTGPLKLTAPGFSVSSTNSFTVSATD
ncbi:MAG: immunoglobulin domain-containing protein, partial [Phycisphaerales bacterium]|nr:immunoglobulin domain-containing protein [Phycisphaerales bacterium]